MWFFYRHFRYRRKVGDFSVWMLESWHLVALTLQLPRVDADPTPFPGKKILLLMFLQGCAIPLLLWLTLALQWTKTRGFASLPQPQSLCVSVG